MKTFQIFRTVSYEYFIEAETEAEAIMKMDKGYEKPTDETELSMTVADIYDGIDWENEKVNA
jgi:hypothetical protein